MRKKIFLGLLFFLFSLPALAKENGCLFCHTKGHNFKDWQKSVHAAHGISCEACHEGDPKTRDPVKAHQGVLPSKDEKSSIHFQNVPKTCGQCHVEELKEFQKSVHYKMLQRSGKGPNCLTCHGSMATTILAYDSLEKTCSLCHGRPTQAAKALSLLNSAKNLLNLLEKRKADEKALALFKTRYQKIQREWHSFDVVFVIEEAEKLIKETKGAMP